MSRRARRARRRRTWIALGAVGLVVALAGAGWVLSRGSSDDASPSTVRAAPRATAPSTTSTVAAVAPSTTVPTTTATTQPPAAPGPPYGVDVSTATLVDPTRPTAARGPTPASSSRTLPVTVYTPTAGRTFPLVVFAHGYDIAAAAYGDLLHDLAAQGFVVVAPDFPLSSTAFPGPPTQADIDNQARDVAFLIGAFRSGNPGGAWSGHVADTEAGVVGHSDGGNTAARVASNSCCFDARVGAAAILSGDEGTTGGQWGVAGSPPMLFLQGTDDTVNPWVLTQRLYDDAASPKQLVAIDGAGHLEPYTSGPQRGAIVALIAAFLKARLEDPSALPQVGDLANRDGLHLAASS